jgi:large subunit ribosomal protein L4
MSVATFTKSGTKTTTPAKLDKKVFGVEVANHELLKQAYLAYLDNGRENHAVTKKRGEVSGGGKKPWKQKGTGRARFGSSRNPIWRGGGIAFGPTGNENYTRSISTEAKRQALRQALTLSVDKIKVVEAIESKDAKTASIVKLLGKVDATRNILLIVDNKDANLVRATGNIPNLTLVQAKYVNVFDVLNADTIVVSKASIDMIVDWLAPTTSKSKEGAK